MATIQELSEQINKNAEEKGFWENGIDIPEKLMLTVSELSEAMEADREGKSYKGNIQECIKLPDETFSWYFPQEVKNTFQDELADAAIRIFDLAKKMNIDLEGHIQAKMRFNKTRPRLHGKKY